MPFIDVKIAGPISEERKLMLKTKLGQAISILNKTEKFLMIGIVDNYELYFGGEKLRTGAYISVSLFGSLSANVCAEMTENLCTMFASELGIPKDKIYITYHGIKDWGWNGRNF